MNEKIQIFLGYVSLQDGCPYVWGGKGETVLLDDEKLHRHGFGVNVFDCSGLVTRALREADGPDWRATRWANALCFGQRDGKGGWAIRPLETVETPEPGDLVFYGTPDHSSHVEVVMQDGRYFGAIGGHKGFTAPNAEKARVRYRLTARPDLIGFRRNPLR
jgi:murein DD-endopeptidase